MKPTLLVPSFFVFNILFNFQALALVEKDDSLSISRAAFEFCTQLSGYGGSSGAECFKTVSSGDHFQKVALETCSAIIPGSGHNAVQCLSEIKNGKFQRLAIEVCQSIIPGSTSKAINCVSTVKDGAFQKEALRICNSMVRGSTSATVECLGLIKGKRYQVEGLEFCSLMVGQSLSETLNCIKTIDKNEFDPGALDVCKPIIRASSWGAVRCLEAIRNASFSDDALLTCSTMVGWSTSETVDCLGLTRNLELSSASADQFVRNMSRESTPETNQALRILRANYIPADAIDFCGNLVFRNPQKAVACLEKVVRLGGFSKEKSEACAQEIYDSRNVFQDWFNLVDIYSPCVLSN